MGSLSLYHHLNPTRSLFEQFFGQIEPASSSNVSDFAPALNIRETIKAYEVALEIPGVQKEAVKIELKENILKVSGEKKQSNASENENSDNNWRRIESVYGSFERAIKLDKDTDEEAISAVLKDGVLNISVPKANPKETKQIEIN